MKRKRSSNGVRDKITVKGFFRVNILENGKVVGDSGWKQNVITNNGYEQYLCFTLGGSAGSKTVARACLGSGTAAEVDVTATTLAGEFNTATYSRTTVTFAAVASKTARFTMTWGSAQSHILASTTLGNIGLINSTASAGSIMAGKTFATSQWNTNQDVQATYEIRFA